MARLLQHRGVTKRLGDRHLKGADALALGSFLSRREGRLPLNDNDVDVIKLQPNVGGVGWSFRIDRCIAAMLATQSRQEGNR